MQNILVDCNTAELVHIDLGKKGGEGHSITTGVTRVQFLPKLSKESKYIPS